LLLSRFSRFKNNNKIGIVLKIAFIYSLVHLQKNGILMKKFLKNFYYWQNREIFSYEQINHEKVIINLIKIIKNMKNNFL
jgi:hypothetical protein